MKCGKGKRVAALACAATLACAAAATQGAQAAAAAQHGRRDVASPAGAQGLAGGTRVVIRRTADGIPHIEASTFYGAGEGYGFAFAQDDLCTMAGDYVTVDAQRSRYFGPAQTVTDPGLGITVSNLDSDFYFQQIIDSGVISRLESQPPPLGPRPEMKALISGYVAGYNRYLASVGGSAGVPDRRCRGRVWVRPITTADVYRRIYQVIELVTGDSVIQGITEAQPPAPALVPRSIATLSGDVGPSRGGLARIAAPPGLAPLGAARLLAHRLQDRMSGAIGSNAVAVGRAGTRDHVHGLLLGNPHFPWSGYERFYQAQLTIPGRMNVAGVSLFGLPFINIGYTATMAWSHTVSTAFRFTPFQLTLVPGAPTRYMFDGKLVAMTSRTVSVQALQPDGSIRLVTRTLYSSRFGPIFNSLDGISLPWTSSSAFAFGDANADNFRFLNAYLELDQARSAREVLSILDRTLGIPWVNTIAADKHGNALYADVGAIPNVTNAKAQRCDTALGAATFQELGLPILDGSRSSCAWGSDPGAIESGLFGPAALPHLFRKDYVENSNDSYWLANPHQPLTGFARIIGDESTARELRTRIGLIMTQARVDGTDGLGPPGFTRQDMQNMVLSNRQYAGELTRDALVAMCRSFPGGMIPTTSGTPVPAGSACDVLADWDLRENLDSSGAVLFRRFWDHASTVQPSPFAHPFNPADPVNTPYGLATPNPQVQKALGDAISDLRGARIPLDASPGEVQGVTVNGSRIPIHGGPGSNGDFNAIFAPFIPGQGFDDVGFGSSYIQVVTWNTGACPDAATILTYSESDNPSSPFHSDQTKLFSGKQWLNEPFCRRDVLKDIRLTTILGGSDLERTG